MSKPDDVTQEVWGHAERVYDALSGIEGELGAEPSREKDIEIIARAILAAEKRGEEREREACAKIAETGFWGFEPESPGTLVSKGVWRGLDAQGIAAAIRARSVP